MTDLKDRTALVTGSTSGIGKATALALATRGARVLVVGRNERRARDVVAEIESGGGSSIVNISTMVASFGQAGMAMYGASRAALELLTKAWAAEYGPSGVRVNAVAPGPTRTALMEAVPEEMVNQLAALAPAGRVARPEELAAAIVFLASDDASFVHGVTLAVDGGRVAT